MPKRDRDHGRSSGGSERDPDDAFLIASMLGGDEAALAKLMAGYDRLVRYTIFRASADRCQRDPEWLDSIASATWAGFVQSLQREAGRPPVSVRAYLVRIARNQTASALRRGTPELQALQVDENIEGAQDPVALEDPAGEAAKLELLEALRACLTELDPDDRALAGQLTAITDRRWREAALALGLKESTLRSRWKRTLDRLRGCIRRKTGESLAPLDSGSDT